MDIIKIDVRHYTYTMQEIRSAIDDIQARIDELNVKIHMIHERAVAEMVDNLDDSVIILRSGDTDR